MNTRTYWILWISGALLGAVSALMVGIMTLVVVAMFAKSTDDLWYSLIALLTWVVFMIANYFRRKCRHLIILDGSDIPEDERFESLVNLQRWLAIGLTIAGTCFATVSIVALGDSVWNINPTIDWKKILFGFTCIYLGQKWYKYLKTEVLLLTWPTGTEKIPIPGVPEKEKEPRRL